MLLGRKEGWKDRMTKGREGRKEKEDLILGNI